jgi:putative copper resistance protein D
MPTALVICRLLHFAATMLLFGVSAFVGALVPTGLARELAAPVRRLAGAAIIVAAVTALAWFALEAGQMGDGWSDAVNPQTLSAVAFETAFGRVWLWRMALAGILVGALAFGRGDRWGFVAPAAGLLLASLALIGHATMQEGSIGALHRFNQAVHLICAGAWIGALPPLILCLRRYGDARTRSEIAVALRRFSGLGHFIVALVVLTGIVNVVLTLGAWPVDFSSPYQLLLALKIALVAAMIALALVNRYILAPRIKGETSAALRALTINCVVEIGLGIAVLCAVSIFATLAPV